MLRYPTKRGARGALVRLALAALLLRALVPAGFMAAPVGDGWPLQLCPSGMATASFQALLGSDQQHHDHHADHSASHSDAHAHEGDEPPPACGLSMGYSALVPTASTVLENTQTVADYLLQPSSLALIRAPPARYHSRAPPVLS